MAGHRHEHDGDASGDIRRVGVGAEMTVRRAQGLKEMLFAALSGHDGIEVDLSEVKRIDTAGMQLLIVLKRESQACGKAVRFVDHSAAVQELMDMYDLGSLFGDPVLISARNA